LPSIKKGTVLSATELSLSLKVETIMYIRYTGKSIIIIAYSIMERK